MPTSDANIDGSTTTCLTRLCLRARLASVEDCGSVDLRDVARLAGLLPSLEVLEMDALGVVPIELHAAGWRSQLQGLSKVTALQLTGFILPGAATTCQLLNQIGGLAGLRRLHLHILQTGWTPAQRGWLTRLPLLTSLDICFTSDDESGQDVGGLQPCGALDEVASAVPHLPALCSLRIANEPDVDHDKPQDAITAPVFELLASAKSRLRLLHLEHCDFPAAAMDTITQLTGLTSLKLLDCPPLLHCNGLACLTSLRELVFKSRSETVPAVEHIACLTNLEVLVLRDGGIGSSYFTQLCFSLPQLRVLDLGCNYNFMESSQSRGVAEGVSELKHLTNLEVLDLSGAVHWYDVTRNMRAPYSLRRFYLGHFSFAYGHKANMRLQYVRDALGMRVVVKRHARRLDPKGPW